MNISDIEQRYRLLQAEFQAGRIDLPDFEAALDRLQFKDQAGRYWMLGAQSGSWYCYDGRAWQPADPRRAMVAPEVAAAGSPAAAVAPPGAGRPALSGGLLLAAALVLLFLSLLALPVGASPGGLPLLAPSPRPPLAGEGGGDGGAGGSGGSGGGAGQSAIVGTVTDLSLGQPVTGLPVSVNGAIIRTDSNGAYSITGLSAGSYNVVPDLMGQGQLALGPVLVQLDGLNSTTVDLAFYSQPLPTDTPQPAPALVAPPALPAAGGPASPWPALLLGLGLALLGGGLYVWVQNKPGS